MVNNDQSLSPLLQIVHISDLHLRHKEFKPSADLERFMRCIGRLRKWPSLFKVASPAMLPDVDERIRDLADRAEAGLYGHDFEALETLFEFLRDNVRPDPVWRDEVSWLVDTGDQSTFGDDLSLRLGLETLGRFSVAMGNSPSTRIHGNHDAWAGKQPLLTMPQTLRDQREWLRRSHFVADYPAPPTLSYKSPSGSLSVDVYQLNSVIHGRIGNGAARGDICEDRFWLDEPPRAAKQGAQIESMLNIAAARYAAGGVEALRIAMIHHPLEHGGKKTWAMALKDAKKRRQELAKPRVELGGSPLAHIVLSGHTHRLHPRLGDIKGKLSKEEHDNGTKQYVVGTAAQLGMLTSSTIDDTEPAESDLTFEQRYPQQAQIFRLWNVNSPDSHAAKQIAVDRIVIARANGIKEWGVVESTIDGARYERTYINV